MLTITKTIKAVAVSAVMSLSLNTFAQELMLDFSQGTSSVEFHAVGTPSLLKIHGKGGKALGKFKVAGQKAMGKAIFDLKTLETGISLRDKHMKDKYLEVGKYPNATFELTNIQIPANFASSDSNAEVPFQGKLTLHGKTQAVSGTAKLNKSGSSIKGDVSFKTKVQAYGIDIPSFAGVTMADEVEVKVSFSGPLQSLGQKVADGR